MCFLLNFHKKTTQGCWVVLFALRTVALLGEPVELPGHMLHVAIAGRAISDLWVAGDVHQVDAGILLQ